MNFCSKCGKELNEGAKFCINCGFGVDSKPVVKEEQKPTEVVVVEEKSTFKTVMFWVGVFFMPIIFAWFTLNKKKHSDTARAVAFVWLAVIGIGQFIESDSNSSYASEPVVELTAEEQAEKTRLDGCKANWAKCADTRELINNYRGMSDAKASCIVQAENRAPAETDFPWGAFGTFYPAENAQSTGKITLIETNAKFQNAFGAMLKKEVHCMYDLKKKTVDWIQVL